MAYCVSCGAYIPDGQSKCLACGYDEAAQAQQQEKQPSAAGAAQKDYRRENEELRRKLEEQRRRQQEESRKWAEQEQRRRQQQEESRKWAQEEYQRRQQEKQAESYVNRSSSSPLPEVSPNKALAALSYVSWLFALPYIFTPNDRFARFHAAQGLRLFIFGIITDILSAIPLVGIVAWIARIYLAVKGITNVIHDKTEPLPYIGTIGEK